MGNEVAIISQPALPSFSLNDIEKVANAIARGGLFGSKDPYAVLTLCMLAHAEGQHPAVVFRDYDLIQGKPAKKAEAMLRDFIGSGGKVTWNRLDDECADATFSHPQGGTVTINWTMARAQKAQLGGKDMWKKYPRQMLRSRVVSEGVRTVCPNATSGLYVPEEVRDFDNSPAAPDTPATPEPKRARDLKSEQPKALEAGDDAKRKKAEDWLAWLRDEVAATAGEVEAVRAVFKRAAPTLAKMEKEYPDLHAEAMKLAPSEPEPVQEGARRIAEERAEALLAEFKSAANIIDLRKLYDQSELDRASMSDEIAELVENAYSAACKRLGGTARMEPALEPAQ